MDRQVRGGGRLGYRADEDVLAYALRDDRVLLTHDRDYLDDRRFPEHRNPGVVILAGGDGDVVALVESLRWALSIVAAFREIWRRAKVVVSQDGHIHGELARGEHRQSYDPRRYWLVPDDRVMEWHDAS